MYSRNNHCQTRSTLLMVHSLTCARKQGEETAFRRMGRTGGECCQSRHWPSRRATCTRARNYRSGTVPTRPNAGRTTPVPWRHKTYFLACPTKCAGAWAVSNFATAPGCTHTRAAPKLVGACTARRAAGAREPQSAKVRNQRAAMGTLRGSAPRKT